MAKFVRNLSAFTLVEILVVLFIIGAVIIFSGVVIPPQLAKARDAKRKADIKTVASAIEEYYQDKGCYPQALPVCSNAFKNGDLTLLGSLPCDPKIQDSYVYVSENTGCNSWFQLYGNLEYERDTIIDKVGCREGCGPDCQFNYGVSSTNTTLNPYCGIEAPPSPPAQYVCAPGGSCEIFEAPELSGCPDIYPDDPTCQDQCDDPKNRCHDSRGKIIP